MCKMNILIVCRYKSDFELNVAPFISDQVDSLKAKGLTVDYFLIKEGYFKNYIPLKNKIKTFQPDIIHAHYGLSGLFANLQRKVPVITTYHGSDINKSKVLFLSRICMYLSKYNIFVSKKNKEKSHQTRKNSVIPCGVDINLFKPVDKGIVRDKLGFANDDKLVLFAGAFGNKMKNFELAKKSIEKLANIKLLEFAGYNREQTALLMNAVDLVIMTSFTEGSPQVIKEAMACNCAVVSTNVGDVKDIFAKVEGCYITSFKPDDIMIKLKSALLFVETKCRINGRSKIIDLGLDSDTIAKRIIEVYRSVIQECR